MPSIEPRKATGVRTPGHGDPDVMRQSTGSSSIHIVHAAGIGLASARAGLSRAKSGCMRAVICAAKFSPA